ncbi:hypothetical protein EYF80_029169 [Liparis tanakae]|uniref:Uncharacterized protein n=1 Tax=Liparis tanakae TaxID=230148 RepID=A0A4Z2H3Z0_9TELE|nr:hypothetical protein EYF80_029169 [Liparis tanakae]
MQVTLPGDGPRWRSQVTLPGGAPRLCDPSVVTDDWGRKRPRSEGWGKCGAGSGADACGRFPAPTVNEQRADKQHGAAEEPLVFRGNDTISMSSSTSLRGLGPWQRRRPLVDGRGLTLLIRHRTAEDRWN